MFGRGERANDWSMSMRILVENDEKQGMVTRVISNRCTELRQLLGGLTIKLEFGAE